MGKKFKIKIKYLIFIPVFLFVIFPNLVYLSAKLLFSGNGYIGDTPSRAYAYGILKLYDSWPKVNSFNDGANYMMGKCLYSNIQLKYANGNRPILYNDYPKFYIHGNYINDYFKISTIDDYNKAKEHFEKVVESENKGAILGYTLITLTNLYLDGGEVEKAKELFSKFINSTNEKVMFSSRFCEISYLSRTGFKEDALEKAKELYLINKSIPIESLYLDMLLLNGDDITAKEIVGEGGKVTFNSEPFTFDNKLLKEYYFELDKINSRSMHGFDSPFQMNFNTGTSILKGKATYGDKAIPYQKVVIFEKDRDSLNFDKYLVTYTNKNGEYSFNNLKEGSYVVNFELPGYLRKDWTLNYALNDINNLYIDINKNAIKEYDLELRKKIRILNNENDVLLGDSYLLKWTPIEGASSYDVNVYISGGKLNDVNDTYGYFSTFANIEETQYNLQLVDGSLMSQPFIDYNLLNYYHNPINILGPIDGREIRVQIAPKDREGKSIQGYKFGISDTMNSYNFKPKKKVLNQGDEMIKQGKINEGLEWYKNQITIEGYKKEYLYPILRSYITKNDLIESDAKEYETLLKELYSLNLNKPEIQMYIWAFENKHQKVDYKINPLS